MTLILKAPNALRNPLPGTPLVPDITSDLLFLARAQDLALANGAAVTSWPASGSGPASLRTLNAVLPGWSFPTFSTVLGPNGGPSVEFGGTHHITTGDLGAGNEITQPLTYAVVHRVDAFVNATTSRIVGGYGAGTLQTLRTGSVDTLRSGAGNEVQVAAGLVAGQWYVSVYVFNGSNSLGKYAGTDFSGDLGENTLRRLVFGSNMAGGGVGGFDGGIAHVEIHNRAFTSLEVDLLYGRLVADYGL